MLPPSVVVVLPEEVLARYERFSLYNSPYAAHEQGRAIDLYPDSAFGPATDADPASAPSPVAGEVFDIRTVRAPPRPYAAERDHLVLVDTGELVARLLHVDPAIEAGDRIAMGDSLGTLVRAGFFAPWVENHVHLEFRPPGANPYRASGSLPIDVGARVETLDWDGTGRVIEVGDTYAVLDAPTHPAPGERFVGIGADEGVALDGGLVHYAGGGALASGGGDHGGNADHERHAGPISLFGHEIGHAADRTIEWNSVAVLANDEPITGLSLFCARDAAFGAKLICPDREFARGERVTVTFRPSDDPVRLG